MIATNPKCCVAVFGVGSSQYGRTRRRDTWVVTVRELVAAYDAPRREQELELDIVKSWQEVEVLLLILTCLCRTRSVSVAVGRRQVDVPDRGVYWSSGTSN